MFRRGLVERMLAGKGLLFLEEIPRRRDFWFRASPLLTLCRRSAPFPHPAGAGIVPDAAPAPGSLPGASGRPRRSSSAEGVFELPPPLYFV